MDIAIAPLGFHSVLEEELLLKKVEFKLIGEGTYFLPETSPELWWAAQQWKNGEILPVKSISDAAKLLKNARPAVPNKFYFHPTTHVRRMELIGENLQRLDTKKRISFSQEKDSDLPALMNVTMLGRDEMFVAQEVSPKRPAGIYEFEEDKLHPPNRAYLKLWDFFTRFSLSPRPSEIAIDLGSSPGGWTWVLGHYFKEVISVDKAPLDERILHPSRKVSFLKQNAFALHPQDFPQVSWLFCDIIAYPEKSLAMIQKWMEFGLLKNFVCTLKFQGKTDFAVIQECLKISGSHVVHLHHNKHELTWYKIQNC